MGSSRARVVRLVRPREDRGFPRCLVGELVAYGAAGRPLVDFPGNPAGPVPARTVVTTTNQPPPGTEVLLAFEGGDSARPVILGVPRATFAPDAPQPARGGLDTTQELHVRAKRLVVDAGQEIVLRSGKASLTIQPDGTVVVRGTNLLSRSSGPNRIKGASVQIN
jgi:hypothetical protein